MLLLNYIRGVDCDSTTRDMIDNGFVPCEITFRHWFSYGVPDFSKHFGGTYIDASMIDGEYTANDTASLLQWIAYLDRYQLVTDFSYYCCWRDIFLALFTDNYPNIEMLYDKLVAEDFKKSTSEETL